MPAIISKWYDVGLELFEPKREDEIKLDEIRCEGGNNKEHAEKMLAVWLENKPDASWNDLIEALRYVGLQTTASTTEKMLLTGSMRGCTKIHSIILVSIMIIRMYIYV